MRVNVFPFKALARFSGTRALYFEIVLFLFISGVVFYRLQFSVPWLVGFDGNFHIKYSFLLAKEGFIESLPWLQFTIYKDYFRDHHLLFHYLLIPFTFTDDLVFGGKIAVVFFSLILAAVMFFVFYSCGVKFPSIWSMVALLSSQPFLYRLSLLRVQGIALALLLLVFVFNLRRQYRAVAVVAAVFVWMYDAFPLVILISLAFTGSIWLVERRLEFRPLVYSLMGVMFALVVNPYFPENISSFFFNIYRTLLLKIPEIQLGVEWKPYDTWSLLTNSSVVFIVFGGSIFSMALLQRKPDVKVLSALCLNFAFLLLTMKSRRFIEYWPVFVFITAAFTTGRYKKKSLAIVLIALLLLPLCVKNFNMARLEIKRSVNSKIYERAAEWLKNNTQKGEIVFNADWDDFPFLFLYNHYNYYIIGLDPMYMYRYDKNLYMLYKSITRGKVKRPAGIIKERFKTRYVFMDRAHSGLYKRLRDDPMAEKVYEDRYSIVFRLL